jgi:zinc/manganese transport system substrate-binding protein
MRQVLTLALGVVVVLASCDADEAAGDERPDVVVTTNILGDVVQEVAGDAADVEVIMPLGADPHDFAPSARQAESMADADLLVVNGAGFEEGMAEIIDAGAPTFAVADHVELLGDDPHLWTDPSRMATAVEALGERLAQLDGIDAEAVQARAAEYAAELDALAAEMEATLAAVPAERRVLVTNHEVFAYFADRFDFDVLGAVVPSMTTGAQASAADLEELAALIDDTGVRAIFAETTGSTELAEALAGEVGDVEVVELFAESLGEEGSGAETYVDMMRSNAALVAGALG